MARGVNKVILVGNLGADPETRYTASGSAVSNLRLATSRQWRDKNTNEMQEQTEWHRVVCFGRMGEIAGEYLRKGSKVYIEGRLQTRTYEKEVQTHYSTEVVAEDMQMLDSRGGGTADAGGGQRGGGYGGGGPGGGRRPQPDQGPTGPSAPMNDDFDDDIPF